MDRKPHLYTILILAGAALGLFFAGFSTADFAQHLDRQEHSVSCSFTPGLSKAEAGKSDCKTTMMSEYSSVMRTRVWGGVPISLPAMSVFAFLAFWAVWLGLRGRDRDPNATAFTLAAVSLPAFTSLIMAFISLSTLHAACKLCIGIYLSSATAFVAGLLLWLQARATPLRPNSVPVSSGVLGLAFGLGVLFVALPVTTYAISAPDFEHYVGSCGQLQHKDDQVLVPIGPQGRPTSMIEVLDPLCPSCRGFETRFSGLEVESQVSRKALLFPLDNECNWMIGDAIHPGACAVSEAMLCAKDRADQVLAWAFENQEAIVEAARADKKGGAARLVAAKFPDLASCVGSSPARAKLNLALRSAVKNRLQVLTPQVFVEGLRLCDEDTDLGLDYALPRLIERARTNPASAATGAK